jgi:hypothetical protein
MNSSEWRNAGRKDTHADPFFIQKRKSATPVEGMALFKHSGRIDGADYALELIHRMGEDLFALALVVVYSLERR